MRRITLCLAVLLSGCQSVPTAQKDVVYRNAAVATDHPVASQAGLEMLRKGGNAVDAAVAASFCLSVVRPYSCGLGGGGFMLVHQPGRDGAEPLQAAINYRETAPAMVGPDYYVSLGEGGSSRNGHHAVGVPGSVAGLLWALRNYGTLDRATVLAPAIRAAERGVRADRSHVEAAEELAKRLNEHPHLREPAAYLWTQLCHDGKVQRGDVVRNPDQAKALRLIAEHGADPFYRGQIADAIVATMDAYGGPVTHADLAGYTLSETPPLAKTVTLGATYDVLCMPPPSSGGVAVQQVFGILARRWDDLRGASCNSPAYVHLLTEAFKHAFADRAEWLADPAFVEVPTDQLLDDDYLDRLAASIALDATGDPFAYGSVTPTNEGGGTSHISVIDADGMAVACTETINLIYGSLVVVPGFGFALNDQMDDFTTVPGAGAPNYFGLRQSDSNLPAPGKRPLSSMSPTIMLRHGRPVIIAGASGGPRIITGTLQCMLDCLLFGMTPVEAVDAPRFHHQWMPDVLQFEDAWEDTATIEALEALGHETGRRKQVGTVQIICVRDEGIRAASDPRKGGRPAGY